ncbi:response regulator [Sphingomonas sp. AAP5]|uniref:response regulator n=1 Tax=Sphingomonas sp. AAP5 TaxID=1523415 RepID=UPI0010575668|nr:response regulator [Sphingomonas sp. AAP5]QBM77498.1 response regulator [Sphingomonas sp. AAP5]
MKFSKETTNRRKRVVVVDDSRTMQAALEQIFSLRLGFDVVGLASDAQSAAELIRKMRPDLVTIDLCMPYIDGRKLLEMIADLTDVRKVIVSGQAFDSPAIAASLEAAGADACIHKKDLSQDPAKFCSRIQAILARSKPRTALRGLPVAAERSLPDESVASVMRPGAFPIPIDEQARLALLRRIGLASETPDEQLDLLVAHLGATTDFPTAIITFIDRDRQWLKATHNMARCAMPRHLGFCNWTLCAGETFVVANAATDARFAGNALVTCEGGIRTYVGQPIVYDGTNLGAICLIDAKPRVVTSEVVINLRSMARIAAEIIKMRVPPLAVAA